MLRISWNTLYSPKTALRFIVLSLICLSLSTVARGCSLNITTPVGGALVDINDNVDGTAADIPPGSFVWVLARIAGISRWYPQGSGPVTLQNGGKWTVFVTYGLPRDSGKRFEAIAAVFDGAGNTNLQQWVATADNSGVYKPMQLPPTMCSTKPVNVTRR